MKPLWDDKRKLADLLRRAYFEKEKIEVNDRWQQNTMSAIRHLGERKFETPFSKVFEQMVWRMSPVACAMIIILLFVFLNIDIVATPDLFQLLSYEAEGPNVIVLF